MLKEIKQNRYGCLLFLLLCAVILSLPLAGCSKDTGKSNGGTEKYKVVVTIFPYYDFIRQIIGTETADISLVMLVPAGRDSHAFEPTVQDMLTLQDANLLIYNSDVTENWMTQVKETVPSSIRRDIAVVSEAELVPVENHHSEYEDHVWTSPKRAIQIVEMLCDALCQMAPEHTEVFRTNTAVYQEKLQALDKELEAAIAAGSHRVMVFGDRFPFYYLCEDYGLTAYAAFDSCSSETEPSAGVMTQLVSVIREQQLSTVYYIEMSTEKIVDTLCAETGTQKRLLHSCHTVTSEQLKDGITYLELMEQNVESIRQGLQ